MPYCLSLLCTTPFIWIGGEPPNITVTSIRALQCGQEKLSGWTALLEKPIRQSISPSHVSQVNVPTWFITIPFVDTYNDSTSWCQFRSSTNVEYCLIGTTLLRLYRFLYWRFVHAVYPNSALHPCSPNVPSVRLDFKTLSQSWNFGRRKEAARFKRPASPLSPESLDEMRLSFISK